MEELAGARIQITGIVQGVGFRPFVYALAHRFGLNGQVCNTSAGVEIDIDGPPAAIAGFVQALQAEAPPLARIHRLQTNRRSPVGFTQFEIIASQPVPGAFQPISPDVGLCADCLAEILDPHNRRYLYPFTNCTNCGPRFTIIRDIPYDRPLTSMAGFPMCPACDAEYHDPTDRRFHAQPTACPQCGPQVWLETPGQAPVAGSAALLETRRLLRQGQIVAIKGLGGFHLACDARNPAAVAELRRRKLRVDKPFALMLPDIETVCRYCLINEQELELLASVQKPIVLLQRLAGTDLAPLVATGQQTLGVMLPYTPLHALLFADIDLHGPPTEALVMTSGNLSEEPIVTENTEALERLAPLADAFLLHDRPIHIRCDDSVMRRELPIRRSRGYAPYPVQLSFSTPPLLATGAELKNTFCLARGEYAFLSHHIGDLENYETLRSFETGVSHFERLFRIEPQAIACDLHPAYLATSYAQERAARQSLPLIGVQHHHAHIAAVMAEHGLPMDARVIGLSFDGTGYGSDGAVWGGEFLLAGYASFERCGHFPYLPLPGGDLAIREPWRMALAWLTASGIDWQPGLPPVDFALGLENGPVRLAALQRQIETGLNTPQTSSLGRLFDAAAALLGVRQMATYEAQAAIEMEAICDPDEWGNYWGAIPGVNPTPALLASGKGVTPSPAGGGGWEEVNAAIAQLPSALLSGLQNHTPLPTLAARFHNTIACIALAACRQMRLESGLETVALSGGVWQNVFLLERTCRLLQKDGFNILTHHLAPPNDGGLALGQAAVAAAQLAAARQANPTH